MESIGCGVDLTAGLFRASGARSQGCCAGRRVLLQLSVVEADSISGSGSGVVEFADLQGALLVMFQGVCRA